MRIKRNQCITGHQRESLLTPLLASLLSSPSPSLRLPPGHRAPNRNLRTVAVGKLRAAECGCGRAARPGVGLWTGEAEAWTSWERGRRAAVREEPGEAPLQAGTVSPTQPQTTTTTTNLRRTWLRCRCRQCCRCHCQALRKRLCCVGVFLPICAQELLGGVTRTERRSRTHSPVKDSQLTTQKLTSQK